MGHKPCPALFARLVLLALFGAGIRDTTLAAAPEPLSPIGLDQLCVTNGVVSPLPDGRMAIATSSSRAVLRVDDEARSPRSAFAISGRASTRSRSPRERCGARSA